MKVSILSKTSRYRIRKKRFIIFLNFLKIGLFNKKLYISFENNFFIEFY